MQPLTHRHDRKHKGHIETGVALIVLGTVFLCMKLNIIQLDWHWYTFVAIAFISIGSAELVLGKRPHKIFEGFSNIVLGAWFYLAFANLWGITPGNSWPVFLILAGIGIMLKAMFEKKPSAHNDTKSE